MSPLYIGLSIFFILLSIALIVMILMQKKDARLGGGMAGMASGGDQSSYWNKNKGRSLEGTLEKYSKIAGALFMALAVFLCLII